MDLRGIALISAIGLLSLLALRKPYVSVLMLAWMSFMNPHRVAGHWSFVYDMPLFAAIIALALALSGWSFVNGKARFPNIGFVGFLLILFVAWLGITTYTAYYPTAALEGYSRFLKIQLAIVLTLLMIDSDKKLKELVWVIFGSIAFFGIKGGIFVVLTGGNFRVWGPPQSFIVGNNELALALIMTLPLGYFLYQDTEKKWLKSLMIGFLGIMTISILASYSRGAFLALGCTGIFLWLKSSKKLPIAAMMILTVLVLIPFMPDKWFDRMDTIESYETDASAQGRINAWHMAFNLASDRITGGGYDTWSRYTFALYAPNPTDVKDAHSIYFEVMGEHGFTGLLLFFMIFSLTWMKASGIKRKALKTDDQKWIGQLMSMCQVSLVAYATGGAFLGLAFWDLPYYLIAIVIISGSLLERHKIHPKQAPLARTSTTAELPQRQDFLPGFCQKTK
ncbi:putative O-glycosylation ligase, exosortase A system-associated [Motiliproteus sp. SC1-56]|uniref:putative O-glycosylation ligase, exosortase A system-associated n=1 Tax=Motiliproteus sp. SC1-56 TaxID=2799565 RepID=UPI001A8E6FFD|nr:putative O-glycosylation ligase, exosortase A system-associated [Motiliproteus sp. SC1-56]